MMKLVDNPVYSDRPRLISVCDWLYGLLIMLASGTTFKQYGPNMDYYGQLTLGGACIGLIALGWFWKAWRWFFPLVGAVSLLAIFDYQGNLARAQSAFWLKFVLS